VSRRLLVTGSTGLLGQAMVAAARGRGHAVTGIARSGADRTVDLTDDAAISAVIADIAPDVVINTAAVVSLDACEQDADLAWRVNARAVQVLGERAAAAGAKLVQISTDHYFTGNGNGKHDEAAPVTILNEYARTKFAAERLALSWPDALVLRTGLVGFRGWPGRPTFIEWVIETLQAGAPMSLFEDAYTSSIDARRFATATLDLVDRGAAGILNLASREVFSKKDLIEALAHELDLSLAATSTGSVRSLATPRAESLGLDVSAAEDILGDRLPGLADVIDSLAAEYAERKEAACATTT
jgi:dTDP-4-dehydrorhamnose reductase